MYNNNVLQKNFGKTVESVRTLFSYLYFLSITYDIKLAGIFIINLAMIAINLIVF